MKEKFGLKVFLRMRQVCAVSESREKSVPLSVRILRLRAYFEIGGGSSLKLFSAGIVNIF
jgi:hypothetical protein